jgi:hypothetical protein
MTEDETTSHEAIRTLVTRLIVASDRARFTDVAACFSEDGVLRWSTGEAQGREAIAKGLAGPAANPAITFVRHHLTTIDIELGADGASGRGRTYYFTISNAGPDHGGVYVDRYARSGAEWLIAHREVRIDWQTPQSLYPRQVTR